jgi:hypothetical protein
VDPPQPTEKAASVDPARRPTEKAAGKNHFRSPAWRRWERVWLGHTIAPEIARGFRLLFFAVLALEMWLEVAHAPRYGAGGFNVSHLPWLGGLLPVLERPVVAFTFALMGYLAALVALGGARRPVLWALAGIYGLVYFSSQLDSYQHHYLLFLVLLLCGFLPWQRATGGARERIPGWPVRLLLIQISIVYLFAAVSKMDARWWSGEVMSMQVHGWAGDLIARLGGFERAAHMVVLTEIGLAVAIHVRVLRAPAALVGVAFHAGIEASGFHIGLFSYFMIALYILVVPERPIVAIVRWLDRVPLARATRNLGWMGAAVASAAGAAILFTMPIGVPAAAAAVVAALVGVALVVTRRERAGATALAHLGACAVLAILARPAVTDVALDYYRFWGGSSRRLGDLPAATRAYERAVEVAPGYAPAHTSLANLYRRTGQIDRALEEARTGQRLAPGDYRPHLVEAMVHDDADAGQEALAAAERALLRKPGQRDAQRIASRWRKELRLPPLEPTRPDRTQRGPRDDDGDEDGE